MLNVKPKKKCKTGKFKQLEECYACANTCAGRAPLNTMHEQGTASVGTSKPKI